jgi:hypothetical protein
MNHESRTTCDSRWLSAASSRFWTCIEWYSASRDSVWIHPPIQREVDCVTCRDGMYYSWTPDCRAMPTEWVVRGWLSAGWHIVKQVISEFAPYLQQPSNESLVTGQFPDTFKSSYITPLIKSRRGSMSPTCVHVAQYPINQWHQSCSSGLSHRSWSSTFVLQISNCHKPVGVSVSSLIRDGCSAVISEILTAINHRDI